METNTWEGQLKDLFLIMASGLQSMASWVHWASKTGWVCGRGWSTPIDQEVERQTNRKMHTTSSDFLQPDPTYLFKFPPLLKILAPHGIQALNTWVSGGHCISKSPQPWRPVGRGTIFFQMLKEKKLSTRVYFLCLCAYIFAQKMTALEAGNGARWTENLTCLPKALYLMTALGLVVHA